MASIFSDMITKETPANLRTGTRAARDWFREKALSFNRYNRDKILDTEQPFRRLESITPNSIGKMYMFGYDPKLKEVLPYYDRYPLVFPIEMYSDGFLAINLHYLPPATRARLMDALYQTINNKKYNKTTQLNISYQILNGAARFRYFKPCVKRYLFSHVVSQFVYISPDEWDFALMLPTESFAKANKQTVYKDSLSMV